MSKSVKVLCSFRLLSGGLTYSLLRGSKIKRKHSWYTLKKVYIATFSRIMSNVRG